MDFAEMRGISLSAAFEVEYAEVALWFRRWELRAKKLGGPNGRNR